MKPAFLLIDKPEGPTSHDVISAIRRLTGERRVGHAGTLDPFASGLLIVAIGREATRELGRFVGLPKQYEATFVLGATSDTDDKTGKITPQATTPIPSLGRSGIESERPPYQGGLQGVAIAETMRSFLGDIEQVPPAYSAVKVRGKKLYEAARSGKPITAKPRRVHLERFDLLAPPTPHPLHPTTLAIPVRIECSSGTYIRALARDLGERLGLGGYVERLRRTAIGPFTVKEATPLAELKNKWEKRTAMLEELLKRLEFPTPGSRGPGSRGLKPASGARPDAP